MVDEEMKSAMIKKI